MNRYCKFTSRDVHLSLLYKVYIMCYVNKQISITVSMHVPAFSHRQNISCVLCVRYLVMIQHRVRHYLQGSVSFLIPRYVCVPGKHNTICIFQDVYIRSYDAQRNVIVTTWVMCYTCLVRSNELRITYITGRTFRMCIYYLSYIF